MRLTAFDGLVVTGIPGGGPPAGRMPPVVQVGGVVDEQRRRIDVGYDVLDPFARVVHEDLMEARHREIHDPARLDLDGPGQDVMVRGVPWLRGVQARAERDCDADGSPSIVIMAVCADAAWRLSEDHGRHGDG